MTTPSAEADLPGTAVIARRNSQLVWTRVVNDLFILDSSRGMYVGLNPTASFVWDALEQPKTVDALVALATEAFSGDAAGIRSDLGRLLRRLDSAELVEINT